MKHLHSIVDQRRISLVIIDSLAMHFRQEVEDLTFRTRILNGLVQDLMHLAVGSAQRLVSQKPYLICPLQYALVIPG